MKKILLSKFELFFVFCVFVCTSCSDFLNPEVFSETAPDNLFQTKGGIESVLYSGYANAAMNSGNDAAVALGIEESMGDIGYVISAFTPNYQQYIMDPSQVSFSFWQRPYEAIRDANIVLEQIDDSPLDMSVIEELKAEAKFIRAISYFDLLMRFGGVPLRVSNQDDLELARAPSEKIAEFIETELISASDFLPEYGKQSSYGRAHKSAAYGYLVKLHLNTKQWQKADEWAKKIIDSDLFELFSDYFSLFFVANEGNKEMIWVKTGQKDAGRSAGNPIMNYVYPYHPSPFISHPRTGLEFPTSARNFDDTNYFIYDSWYDSFDPADKRKSLIVTKYIGADGELHDLSNNPDELIGRRPFKYWPDDGADGPGYGNDIPVIRYADILLSRAEALNELEGPNDESIRLINEVRKRAGVDVVTLDDFSSKEEFREALLQERGWEFWYEGKRREDLVRHGKLIERALERGLPAKDFHVRYPIPQTAMDANPKLIQDSGY